MIIDNDFSNRNFAKENNQVNTNSVPNLPNQQYSSSSKQRPEMLVGDVKDMRYTDPTNNKQMQDKTIAMLQERYDNNLIDANEFKNALDKINRNQ